jgi:hypothetical protein
MEPIKPCLESEIFMERVRREAQGMSRDELLAVVDALSRLYATQRAAGKWLAREAMKNMHGIA